MRSISILRQKAGRNSFNKNIWGILFILPFFGIFTVFWVYPILNGMYLSIFKWSGLGVKEFVGIDNYRNLFLDISFRYAVGNSFYWAAGSIVIILSLSLFLAIFTWSKHLKFKGFFRVIIFAPIQISLIVESIVFLMILDKNYGILKYFFDIFNLDFPNLLTSRALVMPTIIGVALWRWTGFYMMFILAQLSSIPKELNEAAMVDGANSTGILRYITIPLLRPILIYVSVIVLIGSFQLFEEPFILTGGGPMHSSTTTGLFIYEQGFQYHNLGYSSAAACIVFLIILLVSFCAFKYFGIFKKEKY